MSSNNDGTGFLENGNRKRRDDQVKRATPLKALMVPHKEISAKEGSEDGSEDEY
jgi:hypothetical protein